MQALPPPGGQAGIPPKPVRPEEPHVFGYVLSGNDDSKIFMAIFTVSIISFVLFLFIIPNLFELSLVKLDDRFPILYFLYFMSSIASPTIFYYIYKWFLTNNYERKLKEYKIASARYEDAMRNSRLAEVQLATLREQNALAARKQAEAQDDARYLQVVEQERAQAARAARVSYLEKWVESNFAAFEIKNDPFGRRDQREIAAEFRAFMSTIDVKDWDVLHASGNPTVKLIMGAQRALPTPNRV